MGLVKELKKTRSTQHQVLFFVFEDKSIIVYRKEDGGYRLFNNYYHQTISFQGLKQSLHSEGKVIVPFSMDAKEPGSYFIMEKQTFDDFLERFIRTFNER